MRDQTEWTELVENGVNRLTGCNKKAILEGFQDLSGKSVEKTTELYGRGNASELIVENILGHLS